MCARYPGINGRTHGEKKDNIPATIATGIWISVAKYNYSGTRKHMKLIGRKQGKELSNWRKHRPNSLLTIPKHIFPINSYTSCGVHIKE